jgi:hypothetical protein
MKQKNIKSLLIFGAVVYCLSYGVVRWRKCLVLHEYVLKEEGYAVKEILPGHDIRVSNWGMLKNRLNKPIYYLFFPLAKLEPHLRGKYTVVS